MGTCQGPGGLCCQKGRPERGLLHGEPGELPQHCSRSNEQVKGLVGWAFSLKTQQKSSNESEMGGM